MAELLDVIFRCECTSTHHKLAIDALRHLQDTQAEAWRNLFLRNFDAYLDGSKAPDKKFKDFRNHVLHVGDNYWGGAVEAAKQWYAETVTMLSRKQWTKAVYAAGVLSNYYTDPLQPMHTGQSEQEGVVHRAMEWSIAKSFDDLRDSLENELGGYPNIEAPATSDWLEQMVVTGAELAHPHYQMLIDHYDLKTGRKDPPAGFDQESRDCIARLLGHASVGFSRILDRAFAEAAVTPPGGGAAIVGYLARLTIPFTWITKKLTDSASRREVTAIYQEFKQTGKAVQALPEDDRLLRKQHAEEVLQMPLSELDKQAIDPPGRKFGQGAAERKKAPAKRETRAKSSAVRDSAETHRAAEDTGKKPQPEPTKATRPQLKFHLAKHDPIVDAPSIGSKTARRLRAIGVKTVDDLLDLEPEKAAERIGRSYIDADTICRWQAEAKLACLIPNIRGHDAQILVGCELTDPDEIGLFEANELLDLVLPYASSRDGQRVLRNMRSPDLEEVAQWIEWAGESRNLEAA